MHKLTKFIDICFYLRGFLAFILVPIIFLLNINPIDTILLHSNVYLNNYRFPNLNEPAYYCILYFFSSSIFLVTYNYFYKKINIKYDFKFFDKINNLKIFLIYIFLIILFLKLRILYDIDYLDRYKFSGDLLINNFYVYFFIHLLLPNELVFLLLSFYYDKITKSRLINSLFITYILLIVFCSIIFGSRLLLVTSLIMIIFLLFKFRRKLKPTNIFLIFLGTLFIIINFFPYKITLRETDFINYFIVILDHFIWRLDMFHLVDLGFSSGDTDIVDTNDYGRRHGMMTIADKYTGIEFPLFFDYIKVNYSILTNTLIIMLCAFFMVIFFGVLKLTSASLGNFFFMAFLFKFCATWPEMGLDQIISFFFKLTIIIILVVFYIIFEKKAIRLFFR